MKRIIVLTAGGLALLALAPGSASAHTDLHIGLGFYPPAPYYVAPPPVYYEPPPVYYSPPPPVYYGPGIEYQDREWDGRRHWRDGHDRGRHRGEWRHGDEEN